MCIPQFNPCAINKLIDKGTIRLQKLFPRWKNGDSLSLVGPLNLVRLLFISLSNEIKNKDIKSITYTQQKLSAEKKNPKKTNKKKTVHNVNEYSQDIDILKF